MIIMIEFSLKFKLKKEWTAEKDYQIGNREWPGKNGRPRVEARQKGKGELRQN